MTLSPGLRRFTLTVHIVSSVGWIGALATFLALAVAGLASADAQTVRAAYLAMELITWSVIVPLALVAFTSGMVQALGTEWGLLRHYWVLFKLLIVAAATFMLLMKTGPIADMARIAAESALGADDVRGLRLSLLGHAVGGLAVLIWAAALARYKPPGLTKYGWRKLHGPGA